MKDYYNKKEPAASPTPAPRPAVNSATIDAMLDKMSVLIRQREAWANLARLLLMKSRWEDLDEETRAAFAVCYPDSPSPITDHPFPK